MSPPGFVTLLPVSPAGDLVLQSPWPAGVPSGIAFYFQYWIQDPGGPLGAAASNALEAVTP